MSDPFSVRNMLRALACALALLVTPAQPRAETDDYPSKPIRIIVSLAPGGLADMFARLFAQHVTEATKQTVVVENRTGAAGVVGAEAAAKAPADGYTLYLGLHSTIAILPYLNPKLPYDPAADFVPVADHVETRHPGQSAVRPGQRGQDADHGRLTRPVRAEERKHAAVRDAQVDGI